MTTGRWVVYLLLYTVVLGIGLYLNRSMPPARAQIDEVGPDLDVYGYPCPMKGCAYDFYGQPCLYEDCHLSHLEWGHYPTPD